MFLFLCVLLALGIFLYDRLGLGKSDEELITECVENFTDAYNSGDFEKAIESMDAKTRNTAKAAMSLGEGIFSGYTGYSIKGSDLFSLGVATSGFEELLKIQLINITVVGDSASATGTLNYGDIQIDTNFSFVKEGRGWYIKSISDSVTKKENSMPGDIEKTVQTHLV